jgi:hypothetical protein
MVRRRRRSRREWQRGRHGVKGHDAQRNQPGRNIYHRPRRSTRKQVAVIGLQRVLAEKRDAGQTLPPTKFQAADQESRELMRAKGERQAGNLMAHYIWEIAVLGNYDAR